MFPAELVDALLAAFKEIEGNFALRKWKASELDAGHFVEAARRMIDHSLAGVYIPIGRPLANFTDVDLKRLEQLPGDESLRLLVPRALKSIYNIRNKRGVGHLGLVSPNEMDATYILYSAKWVIAEFLRLSSSASPEVVQAEIARIVERRIGVLWKSGDVVRVLSATLPAREQILVHLLDDSPQHRDALQGKIEYRNQTNFRKILGRLHASRLVECSNDGLCQITPRGQSEAEALVASLQS